MRDKSGISDLIEALTIFKKYGDSNHPTNCSHDEFAVCCGISEEMISPEDVTRLERLGFSWGSNDCWISYRFGSC